MERKLNIALVLGAGYSRRLLDVFSPLSERLEVKAYGLLNDISAESYLTDIPLQTFIEDQHLPGFMLGVEEELSKSDVIIASGLTDASTYQAFRYAYHHQKPFLLFCQKENELKKALLEKADEFSDCVQNASGFLVYDENVAETLEFMGASVDKIYRLSPEIEVRRFGYHEKLKIRFRDYLKVASNELLIVSSLTDDTAPLELMTAFKMLEALDSALFARTKLLFVGNPTNKDKVKYRAVDLQLTKSIMFIAQDIRPFFIDLMSASDLYVSLSTELDLTERLFSVLEGMACGVKVLVDEEHPLVSVLDPMFVVQRAHPIALSLRTLLMTQVDKTSMIHIAAEHYGADSHTTEILSFLQNRMAEKPSHLPLAGDFSLVLLGLTKLAREDYVGFEAAFDTEFARWGSHGDYKGRMLVLKGQTFLAAQKLDEALLVFELCTAETTVQREAFLGLAKIAFLTHSTEEALSFYRKALALKPNDSEAMGGIGIVYRKMGMADEAVYWLGKSIS
ncbi:MAG: glycosyltransferase, partial [Proteobacteria bacterium]